MKESSEQIKIAIIKVGESLDMKEATELLIKNIGLYSTVRELIIKAFISNKQDYFEKDDTVFKSYQLIREYCKEMVLNGEVNFEVPYVYNGIIPPPSNTFLKEGDEPKKPKNWSC